MGNGSLSGVTGTDLSQEFSYYASLMEEKFLKGREKHGTTMVTDPLEEAKKECLDGSIYFMLGYRMICRLQGVLGNINEEIERKRKELENVKKG
jgi:hypothetical protein